MKPVNRVRETRKAVGRLIDAFGADVLVELHPRQELRPGARLRTRLAAESRVEGCTACPLHKSRGGHTEVPLVPFWSPPTLGRAGRIAVVSDAPTFQEHSLGELGHGRLWQAVRGELRARGVDADDVSYLTAVACTPLSTVRTHSGPTLRRTPPSTEHAAICSANLMASLDAADVDYVLLLGATAMRAWREDLPLEKVQGQWFVWNSRWMVMPVEHPSIMFAQTKSTSATFWQACIAKFCLDVYNRRTTDVLPTGCIKCAASLTYSYDDDGVPFCEEHWKVGKATREGRAKAKVDTAQERLL